MEKPAQSHVKLNDLIKRRWSPLAFSRKVIEKEKLLSMLEAARWAPSCFNEQPWHFIISTRDDEENFGHMLSCLSEKNRLWVKDAPLLMISATRLTFVHNEKPNLYAWHDIGLAVENMVIQAMEFGIYCHQMAGFDREKAREIYNIPSDYEAVTAIAAGYPGNIEGLPQDLQEREKAQRQRKSLDSFVFSGNWGAQPSFLSDS